MAEHVERSECSCWGCEQWWIRRRRVESMSEKNPQCELGDGVPLSSPGVWICNRCTDEVEFLLRDIPRLLPTLLLIARGEEQPFTLKGRPAQKQQGSQAPINVVAWSLVQDLQQAMSYTAAQYRADPDAGRTVRQLQRDCKMAEDMVFGETEDAPSEAYMSFKLAQIPPMTAQQAEHWFPLHLGIQLTARQVYNWRDRGRLYPVDSTRPPRYRVLDIFKAWEARYRRDYMADTPGAQRRREILFSTSTS